MELRAARSIPISPEGIFAFLRTLDNHVLLMRGTVHAAPDDSGARVRLRGPFRAGRTVRTTLTYAKSPESIVGRLQAGRRTRGNVRWSIQRTDSGSWVEIVARAEQIGAFDRLLLILGGRRWIRNSLELALDRLEQLAQDRLEELSQRRT